MKSDNAQQPAISLIRLLATVTIIALSCRFEEGRERCSYRWPATAELKDRGDDPLGYTVFSEWLNTSVRASWAYSDLMPVIPVVDLGLSPLAQWIVIPLAGFSWARLSAPGGRPSVAAPSPSTPDRRENHV